MLLLSSTVEWCSELKDGLESFDWGLKKGELLFGVVAELEDFFNE